MKRRTFGKCQAWDSPPLYLDRAVSLWSMPLTTVEEEEGLESLILVQEYGSFRCDCHGSAPLNFDYEGLTVGSCGIDEGNCIYIADVGDNTARDSNGTRSGHDRPGYPIYKIKEPDRNDFQDNDILPDSSVSTLWFNYFHPSSPTRYADCEAVFLDNTGWGEGGEVGDFYIVTKWEDYGPFLPANTLNRLFKIPAQAWTQATEDANYTYSPEAVGFYGNAQDSNGLMGYTWTRGEMTFDGTLIALGDYYDQYLFLRCPGMSVAEALAVEGTQFCQTWPIEYWDSQFETIAWAPDKSRTLEISECYSTSCTPDPPMVWSTMDYTYDPDISVACPLITESGATASPTTATEMLPSPSPSLEPPSQSSQRNQLQQMEIQLCRCNLSLIPLELRFLYLCVWLLRSCAYL